MNQYETEKFADALSRLGTLPPDAPLGVLDIGSNSVRLVGYSGSARTPLPIYNERAFCRLGEAVSATGRIEGEPYDLAIKTFRRFRAIAQRLGIGNLAVFATAAVRDADNSAEFVAEAEGILGHKIRVLSGREEAMYSADGVMLAMPGADGIVADLGGGSLELARAHANETHDWASLPLGVLTLREYADNNRQAMADIIATALGELAWLSDGRGRPLYIVGGNWRHLAKIHMEKRDYALDVLHHYQIAAPDMLRFANDMAALNESDVAKIESATRNRRQNTPIAALVLAHMISRIAPSEVIVSANAVREGILYSILEKKFRRLDPLLLACEEMAARMCKATPYGHELAGWTRKLFTHAAPQWTSPKRLDRLRQAGSLISDLAWASHPSFRAEVIRQAVLTAPFAGIDHRERVFLAIALAYRHEVGQMEFNFGTLDLPPEDVRLARALGLSFRLAHSLSASLPGLLSFTRLRAGRKKLRLKIDPSHAALIGPIIERRLRVLAAELDLEPVLKITKVTQDLIAGD